MRLFLHESQIVWGGIPNALSLETDSAGETRILWKWIQLPVFLTKTYLYHGFFQIIIYINLSIM